MTTVGTWSVPTNATCSATSLFVSLLLAAINHSSKTSLKEARSKTLPEDTTYDFVIIGAGSAGAVVANRLSENPEWKVLLLEAGREQPEESNMPAALQILEETDLNWNYTSQPQRGFCNNTSCFIPRGKVLGGTSILNCMLYIRGNPADYDNWAKQGNPGWGYEELLPLFKKSERNNDEPIASNSQYHGTEGYLHVEHPPYLDLNAKIIHEALVEAGIPDNQDVNGENQLGATIGQMTVSKGERWGTNSAFLQPVKGRKNLKILTRSHVTKVLIDESSRKTYGVEYLDANDRKNIARISKEVVVSGGTINSPQILMLSGVGPKKHLEEKGIKVIQDLPGVGKNFHDHPSGEGIYYRLSTTTREVHSLLKIHQDQMEYNSFPVRQGPLSSPGTVMITAFVRTKYQPEDDPRPDLQYLFTGIFRDDKQGDTNCHRSKKTFLSYFNELVALPITLLPKSRGEILLNSANPLEHPLIYQNLLSEDYDMKILLKGSKFLSKLVDTKVFKKYNITLNTKKIPGCERLEYASEKYWECVFRTQTRTIFHPVGTCKMGPASDSKAVVDSSLRVYGIKNLRVADASVMPEVISGNTHAPTVMIGEKASDLIKNAWLSGNTV